jgi:hypothetical protein
MTGLCRLSLGQALELSVPLDRGFAGGDRRARGWAAPLCCDDPRRLRAG